MSKTFRTAVFDLCKLLSEHPETEKISKTIRDMRIVVESEDDDHKNIKMPSHGDLVYIGSHQRVQFLGYLLADESVEDINKKPPFHATHLEPEERKIIEMAHKTIRMFIDLCISDFKDKYPKASIILDPYYQFNRPRLMDTVLPFLERDDFLECVEAFKEGKVYRKLVNNDILKLLEIVDENMLRQVAELQKKQLEGDMKSISRETEEYLRKIQTNSDIGEVEIMTTYFIYCYALRCSLETAAQMMYEAILGEKMEVMSNDNIMKIPEQSQNLVYEKYVVLIQEALLGAGGKSVGSIVLLVCDPTDTYHIKEFGKIVALTVSVNNELGSSSKVTMITVDEELNGIHTLTNAIIKTKLGNCPVIFHGN